MNTLRLISTLLFLVLFSGLAPAQFEHQPAKVAYHLLSADPFDASIVLVVHEGEIPLFSNAGFDNSQLMKRARNLALGEIMQFRLCRASARMQGFGENDFHNFVAMVPMADAEIVRLQHGDTLACVDARKLLVCIRPGWMLAIIKIG